MHNLVKQYREQYDLSSIRLQYSARRGHYVSIEEKLDTLPRIFVQVVKQGKRQNCSTDELIRLSQVHGINTTKFMFSFDSVTMIQ
jgi:hypothetical protein